MTSLTRQGGLLKSGLLNRVFNRQNQPDGAFPITRAARSSFVLTGSDQQPSPRANAKRFGCMRSVFNLSCVFRLKPSSLQTVETNLSSSVEGSGSTSSHVKFTAIKKHSISAGSAVNVDDNHSARSDQSAKETHLGTVVCNPEKSVVVIELTSTFSGSSSSSLGHQLGGTDTDSVEDVYLDKDTVLESFSQQSSETSKLSFRQRVASKKQLNISNNFGSNQIVDDYQDTYGESYSQFSSVATDPSFSNKPAESSKSVGGDSSDKNAECDKLRKNETIEAEAKEKRKKVLKELEDDPGARRVMKYCNAQISNKKNIDTDRAFHVYWDNSDLNWIGENLEDAIWTRLSALKFEDIAGKTPDEMTRLSALKFVDITGKRADEIAKIFTGNTVAVVMEAIKQEAERVKTETPVDDISALTDEEYQQVEF